MSDYVGHKHLRLAPSNRLGHIRAQCSHLHYSTLYHSSFVIYRQDEYMIRPSSTTPHQLRLLISDLSPSENYVAYEMKQILSDDKKENTK